MNAPPIRQGWDIIIRRVQNIGSLLSDRFVLSRSGLRSLKTSTLILFLHCLGSEPMLIGNSVHSGPKMLEAQKECCRKLTTSSSRSTDYTICDGISRVPSTLITLPSIAHG